MTASESSGAYADKVSRLNHRLAKTKDSRTIEIQPAIIQRTRPEYLAGRVPELVENGMFNLGTN